MKNKIVVIDGLGGGIGAGLIAKLKELESIANVEIIALGANAVATERMVKEGAHRGASGENAVKVSACLGDFILGPIGIVVANSMMGEITAGMVQAILSAPGERVLIPLQNEHFSIAGMESKPLAKLIDDAVLYVRDHLHKTP
jgi:hypothetical protein